MLAALSMDLKAAAGVPGSSRGEDRRGYAGGVEPSASLVMGSVELRGRPNIVVGMPFTRPLTGATVEAVQDAKVIAAATTGDGGRYELRVPPGSYLIRVVVGGLFAKQPERRVSISPGETMRVRFVLGRASPMMR